LSENTLNRVRERLGYSGTEELRGQELSAGVAFDHGLLRKNYYEGVHLWLVRRWSAFSIGATSTTGLLLSFVLRPMIGISPSCQWKWYIPVEVLAFMFAIVARFAWLDTMRMLTFMADVPDHPPESEIQVTTNLAGRGGGNVTGS
jgi:hypothetical protein